MNKKIAIDQSICDTLFLSHYVINQRILKIMMLARLWVQQASK